MLEIKIGESGKESDNDEDGSCGYGVGEREEERK